LNRAIYQKYSYFLFSVDLSLDKAILFVASDVDRSERIKILEMLCFAACCQTKFNEILGITTNSAAS
jgi:hypothetical protein